MTHYSVPEDHFPTDQPTISSVCAQAAWREAKMFEERFGAGEGEIVAFEALDRAVAIAVTLADEEVLAAELSKISWRSEDRKLPAHSMDGSLEEFDSSFEELAKRERGITVADRRCLSVLHVLRCPSQKIYAVHGIGTEEMAEALRADVAAIVTRLTS